MKDISYFVYSAEFLEFVSSQENCRKQWLEAEHESVRLMTENQNLQVELQRNEKRMTDVRRQLESKMESLVRVEGENERMRNRMNAAITLSKGYLGDGRVGTEAKDKVASILALLEGVQYKRAQSNANVRSPGTGLDTISEAETTGECSCAVRNAVAQIYFSCMYLKPGLDKNRIFF
jgi:hypothetical protein